MEQNQNISNNQAGVSKEVLWYLDNYILLKDYYDRTISRIAARCIRMGNIAMEEYPFYGYILDVLEEISDTGDYILQHKELYPYVEKKIPGGLAEFKKNLKEYKDELRSNSSPDMIKQDEKEIDKMKELLGGIDETNDPTAGAGMNMDELMDKLMKQSNINEDEYLTANTVQNPLAQNKNQPPRPQSAPTPSQPQPTAPISQPQQPQAPASDSGQPEMRKIIKVKRPISPENNQVIPPKNSVTE